MKPQFLVFMSTVSILVGNLKECSAQAAPADGQSLRSAARVVPATAADQGRSLYTEKLTKLTEHDDDILDGAYSGDGRWLATASRDLRVKLFDAATGAMKHDLEIGKPSTDRFNRPSISIDFSPDGAWLAVAVEDPFAEVEEKIKLVDTTTGATTKTLSAPSLGKFQRLKFSPTGDRFAAVAIKSDGRRVSTQIAVWSFPGGALERTFEHQFVPTGFGGSGDTYAFAPDGKSLACIAQGNAIELYDLASGALRHRFSGSHERPTQAVAFHPAGSLLVAHDQGQRLVVYDVGAKSERFRVAEFSGSPLMFSPAGLLAVGSYGVSFYYVGEKQLHSLGGCAMSAEYAAPKDISFSPDGLRVLAVPTRNGYQAQVLDLKWSPESKKITGAKDDIFTIAASRDGKWLAWTEAKQITLYSQAEGKIVGTAKLDDYFGRPEPLEFSSDGTRLTARPEGGRAALIEYAVPSLAVERTLSSGDSLSDARYIPGSRDMLLAYSNGTRFWSATEREPSAEKTDVQARRVRFAGDDKSKLFIYGDGRLFVYDTARKAELITWPTGRDIESYDVSSDGALIASIGSNGKRVTIWDCTKGEIIAEVAADPEEVLSAVFSGDGQWLLTLGRDNRLKAWSRKTWKLRASVPAHEQYARTLNGVPKQDVVYTSGLAREGHRNVTVKQWDVNKLLEQLPQPIEAAPAPFTGGDPVARFPAGESMFAGFVDEGRAVYSIDQQQRLVVHDTATARLLWQLEVFQPKALKFSPDGNWLAAAYEVGGDVEQRRFGAPRVEVGSVNVVTPDGKRPQAPKPPPGFVKIWNAKTRVLHKTLTLETNAPRSLAFSPDGKQLAVAGGTSLEGTGSVFMVGGRRRSEVEPEVVQVTGDDPDSEISLWNVADGTRLKRLPVGNGVFKHVEFSGDGGLLAFASSDDHLTMWNLATDRVLYRRKLRVDPMDLHFSKDAAWIGVTGLESDRARIELFSVVDGKRQPTFERVKDWTRWFAFSPRGDQLVATCHNDQGESGYVFFSFPEGKELRRLYPYGTQAGTGPVRFSPDGSHLLDSGQHAHSLWRLDFLFDERLQRSIQAMRDNRVQVKYRGDVVQFEFGYNDVIDYDVRTLPIFTRPFELNLGSNETVTDVGLAALTNQKLLAGLDISGCRKATPAALIRLKRLPIKSLNVAGSHFDTPAVIGVASEFAGLESLKLAAGYGDDPELIAPLAKLKNLKELTFVSAGFPGIALMHVSKLAKIEVLKFEDSRLEDDDLRHLARYLKLRELQIHSDNDLFTGAGLAHLKACNQLEMLVLKGNSKLNDDGLAKLPPLKKLRELNLAGTAVTGPGLIAVAKLVDIEMLILPEQLSDIGLNHISKLTRLRELDLAGRPITDKGLV